MTKGPHLREKTVVCSNCNTERKLKHLDNQKTLLCTECGNGISIPRPQHNTSKSPASQHRTDTY